MDLSPLLIHSFVPDQRVFDLGGRVGLRNLCPARMHADQRDIRPAYPGRRTDAGKKRRLFLFFEKSAPALFCIHTFSRISGLRIRCQKTIVKIVQAQINHIKHENQAGQDQRPFYHKEKIAQPREEFLCRSQVERPESQGRARTPAGQPADQHHDQTDHKTYDPAQQHHNCLQDHKYIFVPGTHRGQPGTEDERRCQIDGQQPRVQMPYFPVGDPRPLGCGHVSPRHAHLVVPGKKQQDQSDLYAKSQRAQRWHLPERPHQPNERRHQKTVGLGNKSRPM